MSLDQTLVNITFLLLGKHSYLAESYAKNQNKTIAVSIFFIFFEGRCTLLYNIVPNDPAALQASNLQDLFVSSLAATTYLQVYKKFFFLQK